MTWIRRTQPFQNVIGGNRNTPRRGCVINHIWMDSSNGPSFTTLFLLTTMSKADVGWEFSAGLDGYVSSCSRFCMFFVSCHLWLNHISYQMYSYSLSIYGVLLCIYLISCLSVSLSSWATVGKSNPGGYFPIVCMARFTSRIISLVPTDYAHQNILQRHAMQSLILRILFLSLISI